MKWSHATARVDKLFQFVSKMIGGSCDPASTTHLRLTVAHAARVVRAAPALDGSDVGETDAEAVGVVRARALVAAHKVAAIPTNLRVRNHTQG